jgi:hypothetical protein
MLELKIGISMIFSIIIIFLVIVLTSCTENSRVRNYGGEQTIMLPCNQKLVNVTWKLDNMWVLTKQMYEDDEVEEYTFTEKASWRLWEGKITIKEQGCEKE